MKDLYVSSLAIRPLISYCEDSCYNVHQVHGEGSLVDSRIMTHADLYYCQFGLGKKSSVLKAINAPAAPYPADAVNNAVATSKFFIHNLKITSNQLLSQADSMDLVKVHVPQGYTRCCCLPVDDNSFVTSDVGIAKALDAAKADVLLIEPGFINLKGFSYGFIGGCAGLIIRDEKPTMLFNGDLSMHPDCKKITAFIEDRNIHIKYFSGYPLEDIGSLLTDHHPMAGL